MMHLSNFRSMMTFLAVMCVGMIPPVSQVCAQETSAQVVMRPITTVHSPLVIRRLQTRVEDDLETRVEVEIHPLNGDIKLRSFDLPGELVSVRVFDQGGTTWYAGSMQARKGSDRFSTADFPSGRYAIQVLDDDEVVRHRYLLIKN